MRYISAHHMHLIMNAEKHASEFGVEYGDCAKDWEIAVEDHPDGSYLQGYTWMDNFDMYKFMESIGVDMKYVNFDGENF
jgi:hypothetical protein